MMEGNTIRANGFLTYIWKILNFLFFSPDSVVAKLFIATAYVLVYNILYRDYIVFFFYYMGLEYVEMDILKTITWVILSVLPFLFYRGIRNISSAFTFFVYIFAYIPIVHAFFITYGVSTAIAISYSLVLCIFFVLFFSISPDKPLFKKIVVHPQLKFQVVEIATLCLTLLVVGLMYKSLHFVNILTERDLLYTFRQENSDTITGGGMQIVAYFQGWLLYAFYPFLLVTYLMRKSWIKICCIVAGYVVLFMIDMQKLTLLLPYPMLIMYFLLYKKQEILKYATHNIIFYAILFLSAVLFIYKDDELMFDIGCVLLLRTICVAGWLTQYYVHFFSQHPFTNYGHISFVNSIFHNYPYGDVPLGKVVAYGVQNANANFILTDGYAGAGLVGIVVICIFFYFLLQFINTVTSEYKLVEAFVMLIPTIAIFLNISLFTTFLSNGFILLLLLFMMCKPIDNDVKKKDSVKLEE